LLSLPYLPLRTLKLQLTGGKALLLPFDRNEDIYRVHSSGSGSCRCADVFTMQTTFFLESREDFASDLNKH
jgi:hypothetical protein